MRLPEGLASETNIIMESAVHEYGIAGTGNMSAIFSLLINTLRFPSITRAAQDVGEVLMKEVMARLAVYRLF